MPKCSHCDGTGEVRESAPIGQRKLHGKATCLYDRNRLEVAYAEAGTISALAYGLGVNAKTVSSWLKRHDIPRGEARALARRDLQPKDRRELFVIAVREWSASHDGRVPTQAEWDSTRPPGVQMHNTGRNLFGSWSAALEAAGLSPRKYGYQDERTRETRRGEARAEMIQALKAWAAEHEGESPDAD